MARAYRWLPAALFLGFWFLLLAGGRSRFFRDPGTFWHTRVGERILRDGFFDTDPYTFTFAGARWIPHQWLGEVAMALVHKIGGLDSLLVVSAALLAALFAWLTIRFIRTGLHPVACVAVTTLALAAGASHFHVRPHLLTIVGVAVTCAALTDFDARRIALGKLWWLVPGYLVWSNTHGGALGGLATIALAGIGWGVLPLLGRTSPLTSWRATAVFAAVGSACGLTALVTPYGAAIARTWLDIMHAPRLPEIIREHARTDITDPAAWPFVGLALVYLVVLATTRPRDWRVSWFLPLFWLFQAYARVRHAPLFAVAACVGIADMWPWGRIAAWLAVRRPDYYEPLNPIPAGLVWGWRGTLVAGLSVGAALGLQANRVEAPLVGTSWAVLDQTYWPTEMISTLREYEPKSATGTRLFNEYLDGGFVIYHTPGYRVFVDDRCELFGDEWLVRFVEAESSPAAAIDNWENTYGLFDHALTRTGSGYDAYFRNRLDWQLVRETQTASFFCRRGNGQGG